MRKSARVFIPSTALKYTLPPSPPPPPWDPQRGAIFSRRKLTQPRPPLPACTLSFASSTNFMRITQRVHRLHQSKKGAGHPTPFEGIYAGEPSGSPPSLLCNDVDVGVLLRALDAKFNDTMCLGEQGVIGTDSDVHAGAIHRPALTDQDVSRKHVFTAEFLDAQTLGMRIATVTSTAASFFMCHEISPAET